MIGAPQGPALGHIDRLFGQGTLAGLSDAQLLERFLACGDAPAFEAVVARHGPMVLAVCRGVLHEEHAAADAFQATFLILVRKAGAIRGRGALGGWLHRVAHRVAVQANADARRRRRQEQKAGILRVTSGPRDESRDDARVAVHEEVAGLPKRHRLPVVLCYLGGRTHAEAAAELRCGEATVRRRLTEARERLRSRLARRGVMVPAGAVAAVLAREGIAAVIPDASLAATTRAAVGQGTASAVAMLTARTIRTLFLARLKMAAVGVLTAVAVAWASAGLLAPAAPGPDSPAGKMPSSAPGAALPKAEPVETIEVHGRVLDPDGKPRAGVMLFAIRPEENRVAPEAKGTSGPDGAFRFTMAAEGLRKPPSVEGILYYRVAGFAEGFGLAWAETEEIARGGELILRLVRDVPVRGRILDLQGKPVAGVKVTVESVYAFPGEDLSSFLKTASHPLDERFWAGPPPGRPETLATDAEGRFQLDGIGRERAVQVKLEGPTIRHWSVTVLTRAPEAIGSRLPENAGGYPLHPATFDHLAAPSRPIRGIVRDKESGKPLAGATVWSHGTFARVQTDAAGRYELPGHAKCPEYLVIVEPPPDQTLFSAWVEVADTIGLLPLELNVDLARGLAVRGRVSDAETRRPVRCEVEYQPLYPNPNVRRLGAHVNQPCSRAVTRDDGTYALAVLPGPGVVAVKAEEGNWERYMPASVDRERLKKLVPEVFNFGDDALVTAAGGDSRSPLNVRDYNDVAPINPAEDAQPWMHDVVLRVGRTLEGRIVGPGGEPVSGATIIGLTGHGFHSDVLETDRFTIKAFDPRQTRTLHVRHEGLELGISVTLRGDEAAPVTVRLERLGSAAGRVLDAEGEPRKDLVLYFHRPGFYSQEDPSARTDRDGRFRIDGLVSGLKYEARVEDPGRSPVYEPFAIQPGQLKDLGDAKFGGKP